MKTKLTAIIPIENITSARQAIANVENDADILELRLDYLQSPTLEALQAITASTKLSYILTLRSQSQGGRFLGNETEQLQCIKNLLPAKPDYVDIESDTPDKWFDIIHQLSPTTKIIRSYHNFKNTSEELSTRFKAMLHPSVFAYKIVTQANSSLDSLRMMNFVRQYAQQYPLIGHCMGESGYFSRIAGTVLGNYLTYASMGNNQNVVDHSVALKDLKDIYFICEKDERTKLYALLGDPITYSLSHIFHNKNFNEHYINALYLKIKLQADQLDDFFQLIRALPFSGFSVTMPLKKVILPYVNNLSGLHAVNTLAVNDNSISAINTDGLGALDAIEEIMKVKQKNVLVLGAGGAATAIVKTAYERGAHITIANRTLENAYKISQQFPTKVTDFSSPCQKSFDLVINTLPTTAFSQTAFIAWLDTILKQQPIVMDANYNHDQNPLLDRCKQYQCQTILGKNMFVNQAIAQFKYWNQ